MKSEFEQLIEKYQRGLLSGKEKELMDEWFDAMGSDEVHPARTEAAQKLLRQRVMAGLASEETRRPVGARARTLTPVRIWSIAASLLLLAAASFMTWKYVSRETVPQELTISSAEGSVHKIRLADGSLVWLKNNSSLTYPESFLGPERRVVLRGEALFEVAKDALHPFIIQCGDLTTTVLGTSFNIKTTEADIEVVVLTGKVSLTSQGKGIIVLPSEKAVYRKDIKQLAKIETLPDEAVSTTSGTEYDMNFRQTLMREVIRRIQLKFDVTLSLVDGEINNCTITADLTDQSLQRTMDIITATLHASYEIDGRTVTLIGTGCEE
jgi:ferric-dicitrate binding protein FerR (iron transport regulator)